MIRVMLTFFENKKKKKKKTLKEKVVKAEKVLDS